jgi:hypothetical protein
MLKGDVQTEKKLKESGECNANDKSDKTENLASNGNAIAV